MNMVLENVKPWGIRMMLTLNALKRCKGSVKELKSQKNRVCLARWGRKIGMTIARRPLGRHLTCQAFFKSEGVVLRRGGDENGGTGLVAKGGDRRKRGIGTGAGAHQPRNLKKVCEPS